MTKYKLEDFVDWLRNRIPEGRWKRFRSSSNQTLFSEGTLGELGAQPGYGLILSDKKTFFSIETLKKDHWEKALIGETNDGITPRGLEILAEWKQEVDQEKAKNMAKIRNILLVGRTGCGKSALANVLTNSNNYIESVKSISVTRSISDEDDEFEVNGIKYRVIDTVGIGDTEHTKEEVWQKLLFAIEYCQEINQIFFVNRGRFTKEEIETYGLFNLLSSNIFGKDAIRYLTVVRTDFPEFEDKEACEEDKRELKEENAELARILGAVNIIYVDNPPLRGRNVEMNKEVRAESRKVMFSHLASCSEKNISLNQTSLKILQEWLEKIVEARKERKELASYLQGREKELKEQLSQLQSILTNEHSNRLLTQKIQELQTEITQRKTEIFNKKEIIKELENKLEKGLETLGLNLENTPALMSSDIKYYIMTNKKNNNNKIIFIEWKERGLKDGTMPYEKFKVIIGSEKEELIFYSTFFDDDIRFKKGEIYELSITGNFVEDSSKIIQGVDKDGYEFEKVTPPLLIKELWEEKEKSNESLSLLEENLEKKKEDVSKINQDLFNANREIVDLKKQVDNLRLEKQGISEKLSISEESLRREKENLEKKNQECDDSKKEADEFKKQVDNLQEQKNEIENKWASPENHKKVVQEVEDLSKQLKTERRNNQKLINSLEDIRNQELKETIQTKLKAKKKELDQLVIDTRLAGEQKLLLENLLEKQESLDLLAFEDDIKQTSKTFTRAQEKLQEAKDKLVAKLSAEEVEALCQARIEISKLETSQRQCEKFEAFVGTPDK